MTVDTSDGKATKAQAGRLGARKRWGETPRVARIDQLSPTYREAILALLRADEAARRAAESGQT